MARRHWTRGLVALPKWLFIALSRSFTTRVNFARRRAVNWVGVLWMNSEKNKPSPPSPPLSYSSQYQTNNPPTKWKIHFHSIPYSVFAQSFAISVYCSKLSLIPTKKKEIKRRTFFPPSKTMQKNHDFFKAIQCFENIVPMLALELQVRSFSGRLLERRSHDPLACPSSSSPETSCLAQKSFYYEEMILLA